MANVRTSERAGTLSILVGTILLVVTAIAFQIVAGRSLDTTLFAPIGVIWTLQFIVTSVLLLPVQNLVTRQLALASGGNRYLAAERTQIAVVFLAAITVGVLFTVATLDRFFLGDTRFVVLVAIILAGRGFVSLARGFLAGRRRFFTFGESLAAEGVTLLATGLAVAALNATTLWFAACMAIASFAPMLFRPFSRTRETSQEDVAAGDERSSGLLGWLILATAASQLVLAGAPIVVGFIGGSAATVSIIFATFTLFRGPVTSAYNFVARVLPDFTEMIRDGKTEAVQGWTRKITAGGLVLAVVGFAAGWALGPVIVGFLFGESFRPDPEVAALVGFGVGAALGALFVGQIYIAAGRTRSLAVRWATALGVAAVVLALPVESPGERVAIAFAAGEFAALLLLGARPGHWASATT